LTAPNASEISNPTLEQRRTHPRQSTDNGTTEYEFVTDEGATRRMLLGTSGAQAEGSVVAG